MQKLTFLGTGTGTPRYSLSSAILLEDSSTTLLIDTADGAGVYRKIIELGKDPADIDAVFISHADSDHITGIIGLIRIFASNPRPRQIFGSTHTLNAAKTIITATAKIFFDRLHPQTEFIEVMDDDVINLGDAKYTFFDIRSKKTPQLGFRAQFSDGRTLVFLGDEPFKQHCEQIVKGADVLIHEAFCLASEAKQFEPHRKGHATVLEAAQNAQALNVKTLALWHMKDNDLVHRKTRFTQEVKSVFNGAVFVPNDGEFLEF